jgi:hypothetical protein
MPCEPAHIYLNINRTKIDKIIEALKANGSDVNGNNPWDVDTHNHGIKLKGTWDEPASTLAVEVTDKAFYVPCSKIWENLDAMINHIGEQAIV